MASWMAHLRIADALLDAIGALPRVEFIVGNIAPDSGEPVDGNWNVFSPSTDVSHWKAGGVPRAERADRFRAAYLDGAVQADEKAFYLGYYAHLMADYLWAREVYLPLREKYAEAFAKDSDFVWTIKKDMYDVDHLYLQENPNFRAFAMFAGVEYFLNVYLDYFSPTAFEKKIAYITDFYRGFSGDLNREYPYFDKSDMDRFIDLAVEEIRPRLMAFT